MTRRHLLAAAAGLAAVGVVGLAGVAAATEPADPTGLVGVPTISYTGPSDRAVPVRPFSPGTYVHLLCSTEGQALGNNQTWFRVSGADGGGYVHRTAVSVGPGVRSC
jgi:hypothetical protein